MSFLRFFVSGSFFGLVCLNSSDVSALGYDSTHTVFTPSSGIHYGSLFKHRNSIDYLPSVNPVGVEFNAGFQTRGKKDWHKVYNYPTVGISFLFLDMKDPGRLGQIFFLSPYLDLPLFRRRRHELNLRITQGFAYNTTPYDSVTNPQNVLVSTHISMGGIFSLYYTGYVTPEWGLRLGVGFNHSSNGSYKQPNLGVNVPTLHAGIAYRPRTELPRYFRKNFNPYIPNHEFNIRVAGALKEPLESDYKEKYSAFTFGFDYGYRMGHRSRPLMGFDLIYDNSLSVLLKNDVPFSNSTGKNKFLAAWNLGHELIVSPHLSLLTVLGIYLYDPYNGIEESVFQRYGLKWMFTKNVFGGVFLKTHYGKADYWEFTLGYKLANNRHAQTKTPLLQGTLRKPGYKTRAVMEPSL